MEKNYLRFELNPLKLLLTWLLFVGLILAPYVLMIMQLTSWKATDYPVEREFFLIVPIYVLLVFIGYALFYFRLMSQLITGLGYKDYDVGFHGNFWEFIGTIIGGILFTVLTLGFYIPWFIRKLMMFFTNNSSYGGEYFEFNGRGSDLFRIFLVWVILPLFAFIIVVAVLFGTNTIPLPEKGPISQSQPALMGFQMVVNMVFYFLMIPFFYFSYKWRTRIGWTNKQLNLTSTFTASFVFIAKQLLFSIITLGIYFPMAIVRLYHYFVNRLQFENEKETHAFQYEANFMADFKFLFLQIIFLIFSLGIYYPWAIQKIGGRFVGNTYIVKSILPEPIVEPTPEPVIELPTQEV